MKQPDKPVVPANMDVAADRQGRTVPVSPETNKRLLELQNELERTTGDDRARVQREIERLKGGART